jgi:FkbM family methyltransferase
VDKLKLDQPATHVTVNSIKAARDLGLITREEYWDQLRSRLILANDFIELAQRERVQFHISNEGIEIDIPIGDHLEFIRMTLDINDIRTAPFTILAEGPYEGFQAKILFKLGKESKQFLDVGANMGYYSLGLARINPLLNVQAFEPQPKTHSVLSKNVISNQLSNQVTTHNIGLGSKEETLTMFIPAFTGSGGGSFADLHSEEGQAQKVVVPVKLLDDIIPIDLSVDLMKIDVEGFEYEMLKGSLKTLIKFKPTVVIELLRKWMKPFGKHPQDVIELLKPLGYETFAIGSNSLRRIDFIDDTTVETNFIFLHKENSVHLNSIREHTLN